MPEGLAGDILYRAYEHLYLVFITMFIAILISIPLGIYLAKTSRKRVSSTVLGIVAVFQTIPGLALISFIVVIFALIGFPTIGVFPAIVALVLYALLPITRNTYTGISQVDLSVKEVAVGLGMRPYQVLTKVELPIALPVIMAGIRISTVWTIGIATLCGLIGAGGLGDFIIRGLRSMRIDYLLAGTIPAGFLALIFDWVLGKSEMWLSSDANDTQSKK